MARPVAALVAAAVLVISSWISSAAWARSENPQVIAVHTGPGSRVSMVLQAELQPSDRNLSPEELSVTIGGRQVPTTITPLASSNLSVALVIDTASGMSPDLLEAVQSGATEFLLRLPTGARSTVIAAGAEPRVVARLSSMPADALTAISALRPDGDRATAAGALTAVQELATAPAGPRQIVVFTSGADERGPSIEQLSQELVRTGAVTFVVQTGDDGYWPRVVDRAGGAILTSRTEEVVASYGRLATALEDQYLVAFEASTPLPAVAAVAVEAHDALFSRTLVRVPEADAAADAATQATDPVSAGNAPYVILVLLFALVLIGLSGLAVLRRARRRRAVPLATSAAAPVHVPDSVFHPGRAQTSGQVPLATLLSRATSSETARPASSVRGERPSTKQPDRTAIALSGDGDGVVAISKRAAGPAMVHITGNADPHYFRVRTRGTDSDVVNTIDPYNGFRPLDWDGGESTGFDVRATGPWTITVLPVAAAPSFDTSFEGEGDMVLRFTGDGTIAEITGNDQGRYFSVRVLGDPAPAGLVNTTRAYSGSCPIDRGPQLLAVEATGAWTISIT